MCLCICVRGAFSFYLLQFHSADGGMNLFPEFVEHNAIWHTTNADDVHFGTAAFYLRRALCTRLTIQCSPMFNITFCALSANNRRELPISVALFFSFSPSTFRSIHRRYLRIPNKTYVFVATAIVHCSIQSRITDEHFPNAEEYNGTQTHRKKNGKYNRNLSIEHTGRRETTSYKSIVIWMSAPLCFRHTKNRIQTASYLYLPVCIKRVDRYRRTRHNG